MKEYVVKETFTTSDAVVFKDGKPVAGPKGPAVQRREFAGEIFDVDASAAIDVGRVLVGQDADAHPVIRRHRV